MNKMKSICEQYLEQKDAIQSITTATELIEEFEVCVLFGELMQSDPMKAEKKMDELRACEDRSNEVNETVMEGVEEDLAAKPF